MANLTDEGRIAAGFVDAWLRRADWTLDEWVADFTGLTLPPLPPDEPYVWILEGLETGATRAERELKLAGRLALVLQSAPDRDTLDRDRKQALYNVLVLCSEMRRPEILAGPLRQMLERAFLPDIRVGYNVRFALRQALMMNPPDRDLEPAWVAMAKGETHPFLPSDPFDAFQGVLLLPEKEGEFAVDAMSEVLKALAEALEREEQREEEREERFGALLDRVTECWGSDRYLARFWRDSFVEQWPAWASMCVVKRFQLPERAVAEIETMRAGIEQEARTRDGSRRRELAEVFNKIGVFVLLAGVASGALGQAIAYQRRLSQREARLPVAVAA